VESEKFTIKFEAQLVSTSMTANGGHKITLRVNPEDVIDTENLSDDQSVANSRVRGLMTQRPNTRYICVLVELGEETDEPVVQGDVKVANKAIATLSMLCRSNNEWHRWLNVDNEEDALAQVKIMLEIQSRTELRSNPRAVKDFNSMLDSFYNE
tara:strand:+ start:3490 stop:3951 length:462 start_codon:yes stop_codon:yes gene_type:complete